MKCQRGKVRYFKEYRMSPQLGFFTVSLVIDFIRDNIVLTKVNAEIFHVGCITKKW